ncbi:MAG: anaerobic ribonucleoside-triphosphate reductase activating protein [Rikenellaceae bacterium]
MLKFASFDIVFQEVPNEITLAINITGCPNRCPGCHSWHLTEDNGSDLNIESLDMLIEPYKGSVSCVCFMGGDSDKATVEELARHVHNFWGLKTAWYSGCESYPTDKNAFDFVKLGGYKSELGGLKSKSTNQRFYRCNEGLYEDLTYLFWGRNDPFGETSFL